MSYLAGEVGHPEAVDPDGSGRLLRQDRGGCRSQCVDQQRGQRDHREDDAAADHPDMAAGRGARAGRPEQCHQRQHHDGREDQSAPDEQHPADLQNLRGLVAPRLERRRHLGMGGRRAGARQRGGGWRRQTPGWSRWHIAYLQESASPDEASRAAACT
jgi:hypothetical protein